MSRDRMRDGQPMVAVRPHAWPPGEKALFARRNDLRSARISLQLAREHGHPPETIERLEDLHVEMTEALIAVEREHGFAPGHVTVADPVIAADREVIRDELNGLGPLRRSVEALRVSIETAKRRAAVVIGGVPKYPNDVVILDGLMRQFEEASATLEASR